MGHPSVYPTSATLYDPQRAWSGYTLFQATEHGAVLVDMNGHVVREWPELHGFPNKILPGGAILGHSGERDPRYGMQDMLDLIQVDWEGNVTWKFDHYEQVSDPGNETRWMARAHHDYQRAGNPVGYYAPGLEPQVDGGNTLILAHTNLVNEAISDKLLLDDTIIEVDWQGNVVWEWRCSDHFHELGFDDAARTALYNNPNMRASGGRMGGRRGGMGSFLVRPMDGISTVQAVGVNYSDTWGRRDNMEVTASYFFNHSKNRNEFVNETWQNPGNQYDYETGASGAENYNHRFNARIDYR